MILLAGYVALIVLALTGAARNLLALRRIKSRGRWGG